MSINLNAPSGMSGTCVLDGNGDREPDFEISDLNPITGEFETITEVTTGDDGRQVRMSN